MRMTGAGAARLPAGRCVLMPRMPGRLRLLLPLAALLAPGAAGRRGGRGQAVEQDALPRRSVGPVPDGRHVAVPPRPRQPGDPERLEPQPRHGAAGRRVKVPSVWNLGDDSPASMIGGVGWYRKDFTVPEASKALEWAVRFESVNYRSRVWLNGKPVGSNAGAYIPFELRLRDIKRRGTNRLVIRVDSRHRNTDFPPAGRTADGPRPAAGGTTRACSARSTSSASTGWTGRPCGWSRGCGPRPCRSGPPSRT